jgi:hypothetical protein
MSSLFRLNIPRILRQGIKAAGGLQTGTLQLIGHGAVNTSDYAAGRARSVVASVPFEGFISDPKLRTEGGVTDQQDGQVYMGFRKVTILGNSLPAGTIPRPNDQIVFGGVTYIIAKDGVKTDPVEGVFVCFVRGGALG